MAFVRAVLMQIARVSEPNDDGLQYILNLWKSLDAESFKAALKMASRHIDTSEKKQVYVQLLTAFVALQPYVAEDTNLLSMTNAHINIECARQQLTRVQLCDVVGAQFAAGSIAFPFKRTYMGSVDEAFRHLCEFQPRESNAKTTLRIPNLKFPLTFGSEYLTLFGGEYATIDWITDFFTEEQRLTARRKDVGASPLNLWTSQGFVAREILLPLSIWTPETMREQLYTVTRECTQFKASIARSIYLRFNATRILDFSAGWGDRLIGALSLPNQIQRYIAFDPNTSLQDGHTAMIDRFAGDDPQRHLKYRVFYEPFEADQTFVSSETFDLVFTSPPFFDFETYTENSEGQSIVSFPTFESWLNNFLFASLAKAWTQLDEGGHMVIHINDCGGQKICQRMCTFIVNKLPGSNYVGMLGVAGTLSSCPRPTWVFHKQSQARKRTRRS